jgi:hypothetical protein
VVRRGGNEVRRLGYEKVARPMVMSRFLHVHRSRLPNQPRRGKIPPCGREHKQACALHAAPEIYGGPELSDLPAPDRPISRAITLYSKPSLQFATHMECTSLLVPRRPRRFAL